MLVCAPTGTGKTLIAEAALFEALHTGTRAYYTTPLIALTEQKLQEMQAAAVRWGFSADDVGLVTGNRRVNPDAPVLVVVAEILFNRLLHGTTVQRSKFEVRSWNMATRLELNPELRTPHRLAGARFHQRLGRRDGRVPQLRRSGAGNRVGAGAGPVAAARAAAAAVGDGRQRVRVHAVAQARASAVDRAGAEHRAQGAADLSLGRRHAADASSSKKWPTGDETDALHAGAGLLLQSRRVLERRRAAQGQVAVSRRPAKAAGRRAGEVTTGRKAPGRS